MASDPDLRMPSSVFVFDRLRERGVLLPDVLRPQGAYELVTVGNGFAFTSGQVPRLDDVGGVMSGRLGPDDSLDEARAAARLCLGRALLALHHKLGDLSRFSQLMSLRGYVNADPAFTRHGDVIDAASQLAIEILGPAGRHSRTSIGVGGLPAGALVEIEIVASLA